MRTDARSSAAWLERRADTLSRHRLLICLLCVTLVWCIASSRFVPASVKRQDVQLRASSQQLAAARRTVEQDRSHFEQSDVVTLAAAAGGQRDATRGLTLSTSVHELPTLSEQQAAAGSALMREDKHVRALSPSLHSMAQPTPTLERTVTRCKYSATSII